MVGHIPTQRRHRSKKARSHGFLQVVLLALEKILGCNSQVGNHRNLQPWDRLAAALWHLEWDASIFVVALCVRFGLTQCSPLLGKEHFSLECV